ncbi:MAG: cellulase family glycosylhydrolase [Acetatifactor sp.]|nr:cellulase family glycosylhydrolase [Acetatifactor sp.]
MRMFDLYRGQNAWQMLHTEGNKVFNAKGAQVRLAGVNCSSLEWMSYPTGLLRTVNTACDQWKANTIRLPLSQDSWFGFSSGQRGVDESGDRYRQLVDDVVASVASRQKYVILDLHRSNSNRWGEYISGNLSDMNSLVFWKDVAVRYANHPNVLFDLYNEPYHVDWKTWRDGGEITVYYESKDIGQQIMFEKSDTAILQSMTYMVPGMQKLADTVRGVGANNVLVVGGLDWSYELDGIVNGYAVVDHGGNGIILDSHLYPCKDLDNWDRLVTVAKEQYPIIIGECGHYGEAPVEHEWPQREISSIWVPKFLKWVDDNGYHITAWDFHHQAGPCLVENLDDFAPTPYWGAYVKEFLARHNG